MVRTGGAPPSPGGGRYAAGIVWSATHAAAGVALPFVVFVFFARHLEPGEVGLVAIGTAMAEIVKAFGVPGLYEALLQQQQDARRCHETAAAVLLIAGVALFAVYVGIVVLAGLAVPDVAQHQLALSAVGARIAFDLATLQPLAALAQRLSYRRMALRSVVGNLGAAVAGIGIALLGAPLTGLVAYLVAQSALVWLVTVVGSGSLARPRFDATAMMRMAREAGAASVVRLVAAANNSLDQLLVGSWLGQGAVGYYNLGKRLETVFITAAASFSSILFQPLFSREPPSQRATGLVRGLAVMCVICGLPCAIFVANAVDVVRLVFGSTWSPAGPVAALLAVGGAVRAFGSVHGALLSVSGRNHQLMTLSAISAASGVAVVLAAAPFGIDAAAGGLAVRNVAIVAWMATLTRHDAPRPAAAYVRYVLLPFGAMLVAAYVGRGLLMPPGSGDSVTRIMLSGTLAAACCLAVFARFLPRPWLSSGRSALAMLVDPAKGS